MKILIATDGPHAHGYHRMACGKVFQYCGHEVVLWDIRFQSAYDIFDNFGPDVFWGQAYNLDRPTMECIKQYKPKVALRAFDWGNQQKEVEKLNANGEDIRTENARPEEIKNVEAIADHISFVFNHYPESRIDHVMGNWKKIVRLESNMLACDTFTYCNGKKLPEFESDVTFIGSYHDNKPHLNDYLVNLNRYDYKCKFFSTWHWPGEYAVGQIDQSMNRHALRSAKICPNVSENHSRLLGTDPIERVFSVLGNGSYCISDYVETFAKEIFPHEVDYAKDAEEFHELIKERLQPEWAQHRRGLANSGRIKVLNHHTYFHRMSDFLDNLGIENDILEQYEQYKPSVS
jgi:hypothetical protein